MVLESRQIDRGAGMFTSLVDGMVAAYVRLGQSGKHVILPKNDESRNAFEAANATCSTLVRVSEQVKALRDEGCSAWQLMGATGAMLDALGHIRFSKATSQSTIDYGSVKVGYGPDGFGARVESKVGAKEAVGLLATGVITEAGMIFSAVLSRAGIKASEEPDDHFDPAASSAESDHFDLQPYWVPKG